MPLVFVSCTQMSGCNRDAQLDALRDGHVSRSERDELDRLARELGFSKDALDRLIELQQTYRQGSDKCPHCGRTIGADVQKSEKPLDH